MKAKSILIILLILTGAPTIILSAPKKIKSEINVRGNCGSCKARIEKAAYSAGAKSAEWSSATQTLVVVYNPKKVSKEDISMKVLAVGHDVEDQMAPDEVYDALPGCCQHRHVAPHDMPENGVEDED